VVNGPNIFQMLLVLIKQRYFFEERRLYGFEMKRLRKILRVSWTAKKTNKWVLNKAEVGKELLKTVKAKKASILGLWSRHDHEKTIELPGERNNERNNARCTQAR